MIEFLKNLYSTEGITQIISSGGLLVLVAIVFSETGLLLGFFLPGDALLVTAGVVSAKIGVDGAPVLNVWMVLIGLTFAAILGVQTGYWLGRRTGRAIFNRPDGRIFKKRYVNEAHEFYIKHGGKAVVIAQFLPMFRTFVPFMAGVAEMPYRRFVFFNIFGGFIWIWSLVGLGYFLGLTPLTKRLDLIILTVIAVSFIPIVVGAINRYLKSRRTLSSES
ncbi:MAG: VTT domain-containing protein [Methylacidiphilales bacterium]|nr:VTT domain-containing protein [Candidatus Methylacidiphilales bacterium]